MWGRNRKSDADPPDGRKPLTQAVRQARVDQAERSGVVVDLHDADLARLEILNEALDPLFQEVPPEVDLFDRGSVAAGDPHGTDRIRGRRRSGRRRLRR